MKPFLWICLVPGKWTPENIRAWTRDPDRAASFVEDGLEMVPLYKLPALRPIETARKDGTPILVYLRNPLPVEGRPDLDPWHGVTFVARHWGVAKDGFDIGWQFAAPVGHGGFPDAWIAGWLPIVEAEQLSDTHQPGNT